MANQFSILLYHPANQEVFAPVTNTILEKKTHQTQQHGECPRRISEISKLASENMTDKVTLDHTSSIIYLYIKQ